MQIMNFNVCFTPTVQFRLLVQAQNSECRLLEALEIKINIRNQTLENFPPVILACKGEKNPPNIHGRIPGLLKCFVVEVCF